MKKLISMVLVLGFLLVSCGEPAKNNLANQTPEVQQANKQVVEKGPFSLDYEITDANMKFFTDNLNFDEVMMTTPYYMGSQLMDLPGIKQYELMKKQKVDEAIKLTDDLYQSINALSNKLAPYRKSLLNFFEISNPKEKKLKKLATEISDMLIKDMTSEYGLMNYYDVLNSNNKDDGFTKSFIEYYKTQITFKLVGKIVQNATNVVANMAQISVMFKDYPISEIKNARDTLDQIFNNISELNPDLDNIAKKSEELNYVLKQINTGEYYMALAGADFMEKELVKVNGAIVKIQPKGDFTADDIDALKAQADFYKDIASEIKSKMGTVDKKQLLDKIDYSALKENSIFPKALADDSSYFGSAIGALGTGLSFAGSVIKNGATLTKDIAVASVGAVKTGAGLIVDTTGAVVKGPMDFGMGLYYGNSWSEIHNQQMQNFQQVGSNFLSGKSGSDTFKFAIKTMDQVEGMGKGLSEYLTTKTLDTVGSVANWAYEKTTGEKIDPNGTFQNFVSGTKDWTVWGAGQLGKITTGFFTGLAKGTYRLADPQSTVSENVEGAIDVVFSGIGGTKAALKATQVLYAGKEVGKKYLGKTLNFLSKWGVDKGIEKLSALTGYLKTKFPNASGLVTSALDGGINKLSSISSALKDKGNAIKESIETMWKGARGETAKTIFENAGEAKKGFINFVTQGFENSYKGYAQAIMETVGKSFTDYFDNIIGAKADDTVKDIVKWFLEKNEVPGFVIFDGEYAGTWNFEGGSMPINGTVKNGVVTAVASYSASYPGVSVSFKINMNGTVDDAGKVAGTISGGGKITGQISGSATSGGSFDGNILNGVATLNYNVSGNTTISGGMGYGGGIFGGNSSGVITMKKK